MSEQDLNDAIERDPATTDAHIAAYCFTGAVFVGFTLYWVVQIQAVREMLALAYG